MLERLIIFLTVNLVLSSLETRVCKSHIKWIFNGSKKTPQVSVYVKRECQSTYGEMLNLGASGWRMYGNSLNSI